MENETKVCSKCSIEKPLTIDFFYYRKDIGKYRNNCKDCQRLKSSDNYASNKDAILVRVKEYGKKNKDTIYQKKKLYRSERAQHYQKLMENWRINNRDYYLRNKARLLEYERKRKRLVRQQLGDNYLCNMLRNQLKIRNTKL